MTYIPTPGPLPGKPWQPSNSTDGHSFLLNWCTYCARDKAMREGAALDECDDNELCEIVAASFRGEAVEWRKMPDGETRCIAFVSAGDAIPAPRCPLTLDLFEA